MSLFAKFYFTQLSIFTFLSVLDITLEKGHKLQRPCPVLTYPNPSKANDYKKRYSVVGNIWPF